MPKGSTSFEQLLDAAVPLHVRGQAIRRIFSALYLATPQKPQSMRQRHQIACPGGGHAMALRRGAPRIAPGL
jgi:hypothetical protein